MSQRKALLLLVTAMTVASVESAPADEAGELFSEGQKLLLENFAENLTACDPKYFTRPDFLGLAIPCWSKTQGEEVQCNDDCTAFYNLVGINCEEQTQSLMVQLSKEFVTALDSNTSLGPAAAKVNALWRGYIMSYGGPVPPADFLDSAENIQAFGTAPEYQEYIALVREVANGEGKEDSLSYVERCFNTTNGTGLPLSTPTPNAQPGINKAGELYSQAQQLKLDNFGERLTACDPKNFTSPDFLGLAIPCWSKTQGEEAECNDDCTVYYNLVGIKCEEQREALMVQLAQDFVTALDSNTSMDPAAVESLGPGMRAYIMARGGNVPTSDFLDSASNIQAFGTAPENQGFVAVQRSLASGKDEDDTESYAERCFENKVDAIALPPSSRTSNALMPLFQAACIVVLLSA